MGKRLRASPCSTAGPGGSGERGPMVGELMPKSTPGPAASWEGPLRSERSTILALAGYWQGGHPAEVEVRRCLPGVGTLSCRTKTDSDLSQGVY